MLYHCFQDSLWPTIGMNGPQSELRVRYLPFVPTRSRLSNSGGTSRRRLCLHAYASSHAAHMSYLPVPESPLASNTLLRWTVWLYNAIAIASYTNAV